jgi:hypothetical protein
VEELDGPAVSVSIAEVKQHWSLDG